jgi:hypothetical protein
MYVVPWTPLDFVVHGIFFIFVDEYFRYTHIYFVHKICEALAYFTQYKSLVKDQTGKNNLILCFDNVVSSFPINLINFVPIFYGIQH